MDNKKINVEKLVKAYLKNFPRSIKVRKVFLFGSYATGQIRKDSDVDIIVVSPDFKKINFMKRMELLSKLRQDKLSRSVPMDIIGYTPEEFENIDKESVVMRQAKREDSLRSKKIKLNSIYLPNSFSALSKKSYLPAMQSIALAGGQS